MPNQDRGSNYLAIMVWSLGHGETLKSPYM